MDVATPVVDALSESLTKLQWALTEAVAVVEGSVVVVVEEEVLPPPPHATIEAAKKDAAMLAKRIFFMSLM